MTGQIVTAKIISLSPHPDAKKLKLCKVFDGHTEWQIVCGAANAREGMITILAQTGSVLPSGLGIEKANLRGVDSYGMLCSAKELSLSDEGGIIDLPPDTILGVSFSNIDALKLSSTPWYSYQEKESFWECPKTNKILITRDGTSPGEIKNAKLISKTYWKEDQYIYRNF